MVRYVGVFLMPLFSFDSKNPVEKDFSWMAGSTGVQRDSDWLGAAMRCKWLPDKFLSGIGDSARLVTGKMAIAEELMASFRLCRHELHVCTQGPYLLTQLGTARQLLTEFKTRPAMFLYTKSDSVARAGFALSDILSIKNIQHTQFVGDFVVFDDRSAMVFLTDDPQNAEQILRIESTYSVNFLKSLAVK
ncbi:MAG: hypothetical protein Q7R47_04460 [Candidatus Diapherotrites archaeon]|nr:hypothetical protein [Candidatus Diapherotrites archaeon]